MLSFPVRFFFGRSVGKKFLVQKSHKNFWVGGFSHGSVVSLETTIFFVRPNGDIPINNHWDIFKVYRYTFLSNGNVSPAKFACNSIGCVFMPCHFTP